MLNLILGPDPKVNTEEILTRLLTAVSHGKDNQFLIVPEQYSFEMERLLCRRGGDTISRFAEVLSLTRLAGRVESIYGGAGRMWLDKGGRFLAAAQAAEQVHSRLKLFASSCQKPEFLLSFLSCVDEFGGYGVTADVLREMSDKFEGQFAQKLEELSLLYESYLAVCSQAKDPAIRLQNLRDVLLREDFAQDKDFYVCLFGDFTALENEILQNLILSANSVTLALPEETVAGVPVYPMADAEISLLKNACAKMNREVTCTRLGFSPNVPDDLRHLQENISGHQCSVFSGCVENLRFSVFETAEEECRSVAAEIRRLVENGARYRDIAVVSADASATDSTLSRVLDSAGIPHYVAGKKPVTLTSGAQCVLLALNAVASGFELSAMMDFLKTPASGLEQDACDRLENYSRMWNIHGKRWEQEWTWNPSGLSGELRESDEEKLSLLNLWKNQGISALLKLSKVFQKAENVSQMAGAVFAFMEAVRLPEILQSQAETLQTRGEPEKARQNVQVFDILADALEQICLVMPQAVRNAEDFSRLYEKLLEQYTVGTVPTTVDEVSVGELSTSWGRSVKHLLVISANEGVLPACGQGVSLFTEEERKQLLSAGVTMAPLRSEMVDRELGRFYSLLRCATSSVYISCFEEPSYLLIKAAALFGTKPSAVPQEILLNSTELAAALLRMGEISRDDAVSSMMESLKAKSRYQFGLVEREQLDCLYGRELRLSASRIDKFVGCRFAFFLQYGLKLQPRQEATFDASAFGTFVHAVLENTCKRVMEAGGFSAVDEEELLCIANECMDEYEAEILADLEENDVRFRHHFLRHREETLCVVRDLGEELRASDFVPVKFELQFSDDGEMPPIRVQGKTAQCSVSGFVDRVDLYRHGDTSYVRVVDYKTGHKDFDYTDIAIGQGMQMLIYLFALTGNGEKLFDGPVQPAGVLYHPARQDVISNSKRMTADEAEKKHRSAHCRKGLIANNDVVIRAMEHFDDAPRFLPISKRKDDTFGGDLADAHQMKALEKHVFDTLGRLSDEIYSGEVSPNPVIRGAQNSACTYCDFYEVCQRDFAVHKQNVLKRVSNTEFFADLERKESDHG